ncbi:hypothetical protein DL95DRAFT_496139 [Leptodontidium sp. 2 PMI_412]|nr:hypothetical protein DL95DRAFT_496139 [Leptodontidium sp. 2 PMI_412]
MSTIHGSAVPPPGVAPNFDHPTDVLKTINIVTCSLVLILSTFAVLGRVYVRVWVTRLFYIEDFSSHGGGVHQWEVTAEGMIGFQQVKYAASILYGPAAWCTKVTLLLSLVRIFSPFRKTVVFINTFIITMFIYYVAITIVKIRICDPIAAAWDPKLPAKCIDRFTLYVFDTTLSVITDLVVLIMPLPLVWSLQVTLKKKLRIMSILGAGGVATSASVVRLVLLLLPHDIADQTVSNVPLYLLVTAELGIGIICACVPTFNIFTRYMAARSQSRYAENSMKLSRRTRSNGTQTGDRTIVRDIVPLISPLERVVTSTSVRK